MDEEKKNDNLINKEQESLSPENAPQDQFVVAKEEVNEEKPTVLTETIFRESEEKVKDQKTNKSRIINIAFFIISVLVLVITLLVSKDKDGAQNISELFNSDYKLKMFLYIFLVFVAIMALDSIRTHILLYKVTKINRPILSYKSTAICRYYDCITPFTFGGQPFQIYYLNTRGVKSGVATSVPMAKYIFNTLSFCMTALIVLIVANGTYGDQSTLIITWSIISLAISILFLLGIVFITVSKKTTPKIIMWLLKLLHKLKLVKNYHTTFMKWTRSLYEYQRSVKYYLRDFGVTIVTFVSSVGMVLLRATIPYLIYIMLVPKLEVGFSIVFCKFILCELATMYIPLPGGAGMAEISFAALFASLFDDGTLFWALLIYRIATYYIYLAQGAIIILYDIAIGDKRNAKFKNTKLLELQLKAQEKKDKKR